MGIWSVSEVVECSIVFDNQTKGDCISCYQLENICILARSHGYFEKILFSPFKLVLTGTSFDTMQIKDRFTWLSIIIVLGERKNIHKAIWINVGDLISENFLAEPIDVALSIQKFAYSRHRFLNDSKTTFKIIQMKSFQSSLRNILISYLSTVGWHLRMNVGVTSKSKRFT